MLAPLLSEPLRVERLTIPIKGLSSLLEGTKIVQLSDLHDDGLCLSSELLTHAITLSNQEQPDLVVLTGDYITNEANTIYSLAPKLKLLQSRVGTYAVLGNHDVLSRQGKPIVTEALTEANIKVLCNEIVSPFEDNLPIVGLADFWSGEFNPEPIMAQLGESQPRLVLSHNPDTASILQRWRVDLQLSGHTHGGQIVIPGFGPGLMLLQQVREHIPQKLQNCIPYVNHCSGILKNWQWHQGWHHIGGNQLYVNRGLGTYFPGRFFCPPELTVITLVSG
ncbi:metallophosphoesterase [Crocosphaera chwakensis]|uniref:Metallophosphoesterase n=1 Tax=Crocosphaera chwakensis CCY0110 TaxID=391612 RepID=A3IM00_9CHRO|nr:metallophosphoesterase [Crocosphaera chwakensis]EAZ92456.1 Metallophosphoesterase [Crocosphaera chwakensis CCY0110]